MMKRTLTSQEMLTAGSIGMRRQIFAFDRALRNFGNHSHPADFDLHIVGAMAELVVAKIFNLFWDDHVGHIAGRDVGGILEVRCRRPVSGLDLPIRLKDGDEKPFVLVHAEPPLFTLVGWTTGHEGKLLGEWNDLSQQFYVPGRVPPLYDIADLFPLVEVLRHQQLAAGNVA